METTERIVQLEKEIERLNSEVTRSKLITEFALSGLNKDYAGLAASELLAKYGSDIDLLPEFWGKWVDDLKQERPHLWDAPQAEAEIATKELSVYEAINQANKAKETKRKLTPSEAFKARYERGAISREELNKMTPSQLTMLA